MSFFYDSTTIEPDKDTAFLDALVSMTSNDVFVGVQNLRNADVWSAIRIIASDIASNRIKFPTSQTLETLVNDKPNQYSDGWHFKFLMACQMLLSGNSFAQIKPNELKFIPNSQMTVSLDDETGEITYMYQPTGTRAFNIPADEIIHLKCFSIDGASGISPLYALQDELSIQKNGNRLLKGFFSQPQTNVLKVHKTDLSSSAKESIRGKFESANNNALDTVILDDSMDLSRLQIDSGILKIINSNSFTTQKIASVFGLPQSMLNVEEVHSNQEQTSSQYYNSTIYKYFDCIASELTFKLGKQCYFDDSNLQINRQQEIDNILAYIQAGIIDTDTAKTKLGI